MMTPFRFLVGAFLFALTGYLGIHKGLVPSTGIDHMEERLQREATLALAEAGHRWASVTMDGQKAILSGTATDREAAEAAARVVRHAAWSGGLVAGGITATDISRVRFVTMRDAPLPVAAPYSWSASLAEGDGPLRIVGFVPEERMRRALVMEAQSLFEREVIDEMQLARGVPSAGWYRAAALGLAALSELESGELQALDRRFTLQGIAASPRAAALAQESLAAFPAGLNAVPMIATRPAGGDWASPDPPDLPDTSDPDGNGAP